MLGPAYRLFYEAPLHPVRGEGVWLARRRRQALSRCVQQRRARWAHCHPHVVEAIARQAGVLNTHTRYLHEGVLDYAERLLATHAARTRPCDVHLHRQRGQRPRDAHRQGPHQGRRADRHALRVPRRDRVDRRRPLPRSGASCSSATRCAPCRHRTAIACRPRSRARRLRPVCVQRLPTCRLTAFGLPR